MRWNLKFFDKQFIITERLVLYINLLFIYHRDNITSTPRPSTQRERITDSIMQKKPTSTTDGNLLFETASNTETIPSRNAGELNLAKVKVDLYFYSFH